MLESTNHKKTQEYLVTACLEEILRETVVHKLKSLTTNSKINIQQPEIPCGKIQYFSVAPRRVVPYELDLEMGG